MKWEHTKRVNVHEYLPLKLIKIVHHMQMSEFANWMNRNNVVFVSIAGSTSISNQFNDERTRKHLQSQRWLKYTRTHAYGQIAAFITESGYFIIEMEPKWIQLLYWTKMTITKSITRKCMHWYEFRFRVNVLWPLLQIQSSVYTAQYFHQWQT